MRLGWRKRDGSRGWGLRSGGRRGAGADHRGHAEELDLVLCVGKSESLNREVTISGAATNIYCELLHTSSHSSPARAGPVVTPGV